MTSLIILLVQQHHLLPTSIIIKRRIQILYAACLLLNTLPKIYQFSFIHEPPPSPPSTVRTPDETVSSICGPSIVPNFNDHIIKPKWSFLKGVKVPRCTYSKVMAISRISRSMTPAQFCTSPSSYA